MWKMERQKKEIGSSRFVMYPSYNFSFVLVKSGCFTYRVSNGRRKIRMELCHQTHPNQMIATHWRRELKQSIRVLTRTFKWWCKGTSKCHRVEWEVVRVITRYQFRFQLEHITIQICYKPVLKWRIKT